MGATKLSFKSKGMVNSIRVQGGHGLPPNVLAVFSNDTAGVSVEPNAVRCFVEQRILTMGDMQIFLDDSAIKQVHYFLSAQFKARDIYWGC
ncbi:hypothetical protein OLEAN_C08540 [Oleispira antarctica RB-8]|uniref:Uncharacterized protein n=1 Tax=Oleispira antarctica RB-8 TaxID=698738 RepID=R4YKY7_OLEAN|nr:hypothetical protein OLEAN_C08540 [Oleispira antarctica RB-8]